MLLHRMNYIIITVKNRFNIGGTVTKAISIMRPKSKGLRLASYAVFVDSIATFASSRGARGRKKGRITTPSGQS